MGIAVADKVRYENAVKKLFPQGAYWDEQLSDPASDVSLFVKAKTDELIRFRSNISKIYDECRVETAVEMLDDWERVLLDELNNGKPIEERRTILLINENVSLNRAVFQGIASIFGFDIVEIYFPYRPAFFGFSCFGFDSIAAPASWQAITISVAAAGSRDKIAQFEAFLKLKLLANYIPQFLYVWR
jgi:uncharacterized protein YmfQ (DUF2313 family)